MECFCFVIFISLRDTSSASKLEFAFSPRLAIFSEGTESQKSSETLAKEIGGSIVPIYTLETKPADKTYLEAMKDNYEKIYNQLK